MSQTDLLQVQDLKVHFPLPAKGLLRRSPGAVKAVDGVSFSLAAGQTLGLVGESGCGKSTVGKAIVRLVPITSGTISYDGIPLSSLEGDELRSARRHVQMIFQDPYSSLNPRQNVGSILAEPIRTHGLRDGSAVGERVLELLDSVGLPRGAANRYPHEFSGGQRQRISIARAMAAEPSLIVADEPVSALDVSIQAQVINLLEELQANLGLTFLMISHDLAVVQHIADHVAVMYLGTIVEKTTSAALYAEPLHPYTLALLSAVPVPDPVVEDRRQRIVLQGDLPSPANPPSGCRFRTRCPYAQLRCAEEVPELRELRPGHLVACHFAGDLPDTPTVGR
jgi:peptide/nickel transport system ATP-binding protein